jgi:hypothetical protein
LQPQAENAYLFELASQCRGAVAAVERMNIVLRSGGLALDFFHHAQAFVNHAGAVSRILWPPFIRDAARRAGAEARAQHLRNVLTIIIPHPLEDRTLRNHLEHFDERLDEWATSTTSFNYVDLNIAPVGAISAGPPEQYFRQFDPTTNTLSFRGDSFDLQAIATAIESVGRAVGARQAALRP